MRDLVDHLVRDGAAGEPDAVGGHFPRQAGALRRPRRAVVQVTDRGRQLLASGSAVDNKVLE
jgi:hypothetical protein